MRRFHDENLPLSREELASLNDSERIYFYECLAHRMTVAIRAIWSDEDLPDHEKVDQMKWMNDILHRVTLKISRLRTGSNKWSDEDSWSDIKHWVAQNRGIEGHVGWVLQECFCSLIKLENAE